MSENVQHKYSLSDTTRRRKKEISRLQLIVYFRIVLKELMRGYSGFCLIRKIVPKYGIIVAESPFAKFFLRFRKF